MQAFDWEYYVNKHQDLKALGINCWGFALNHFIAHGIKQGRKSVLEDAPNSNFDWEFYVNHNHLSVSTQENALKHYQQEGFFSKLPYCKKLTMVILLHLYDLKIMDEFIDQINRFMQINDVNLYYIKINIPVSLNIQEFDASQMADLSFGSFDPKKATELAPYHPELITQDNYLKLGQISAYLKRNLNIPSERIQIIFSKNNGLDIGGFFLLLDQLIKQNLAHDFIVKLHTKSSQEWRNILTSFLNININILLRKNECLYSNKIHYSFNEENDKNIENLKRILNLLELPQKDFNFCGGTMFIASEKMTQFFKKYDLIKLFAMLNADKKQNDGLIEHAFERFFGYVTDHLNLKTQIIDYYPIRYKNDNKLSNTKNIPQDYDANKVHEYIKKFNIKIMALYYPQFHEFRLNNKLWGNGFTEWTLLNKYTGRVKKPHIDIGQYNMLDYYTRKKQALIAKEHGISAFCYYHYWLKDRPLMNKGIEKILSDGQPDIPFAFFWANESWTKNWDGSQTEVLVSQEYGLPNNWIKHYEYLAKFFKHKNYIKENNCPILYIYKVEHIIKNNALKMLGLWKQLAKKDGFNGLKIVSILGSFENVSSKLEQYIDGYAEFQPSYNSSSMPNKIPSNQTSQLRLDTQELYKNITANKPISNDYTRGVFYGCDNSCRRPNGTKSVTLSYKSFGNLLVKTVENIALHPNKNNNFILLNSWNSWSEQAMIEPNDHDGYEILKVIKKIFVPTTA